MTDANTLTCAALYELDGTFRELINVWVRERRCPVPLVDRCLDFGLDAAAECARWCATEPERPVFYPVTENGERPYPCGPYPTMNRTDKGRPQEWFWFTAGHHIKNYASDVPAGTSPAEPNSHLHPSPVAAIVWLLDNWKAS